MNRWKTWVTLAVLILVGVAVALWVQRYNAEHSPVQYRTEAITEGEVTKKVTATGSLQAVTKTSVGSEVSGKIIKLYVDYNSKVRKGDMLAQIDPSTFSSQVESQQANVSDALSAQQNAEAGLLNAQSGITKGEAAVLSAQAQVESARATLANSKSGVINAQANVAKAHAQLDNSLLNYKRQQELLQRNLVARSDVDTARSQYLQDKAGLESVLAQAEAARATYQSNLSIVRARQADVVSANSGVDGARAQANVSQAQIGSATAKVRQARANLEQAQLNLSRTRITSPIDGIVIDRKVTIGQTVAAQFQAPDLFTLAQNLEEMQVEVTVDEADIGQVKNGAPVTFTVDSYPEDTFTGKVTEIRLAPVTVQGVVTYTVIVRTRNPALKLMPGMTATVGVQVATKENVLQVSNAALRFKAPANGSPSPSRSPRPSGSPSPGQRGGRQRGGQSRATLYTLDGNKLVPHRAKLGISDGTRTEIVESDLKVGDQVVVEAIVPGAPSGSNSTKGGSSTRGMRMY